MLVIVVHLFGYAVAGGFAGDFGGPTEAFQERPMWLSNKNLPTRIWMPDAEPELPQFDGPTVVANLGARTRLYASALSYLAAVGWREASLARRVLLTEAGRIRGARRSGGLDLLDSGKLAPVSLHSAARWHVDGPGIVSLQLLVHLWLPTVRPGFNAFWKKHIRGLDRFNKDTRLQWWAIARYLFSWSEGRPYGAKVTYYWIPATVRRPGWEVIRRIRDRFYAFAPK